MTEHPNAARLRDIVARFQGGDLDALVSAYTPDATYRVAGDNIISGAYTGHEAIRDFFVNLMTITDRFDLELRDILADDEHAVMFWGVVAERQGHTLEAKGAMAFRIGPDGRYPESWFLYNDQRAYDAFYS